VLVILERAHIGKPGRHDLGAGADLDGDGLVEVHEREAELTPLYINAARDYLESKGHEVTIIEKGTYRERQEAACALARDQAGPVAYVACHLNAGGGSYGLTIHDHRSSMGSRLAHCVATSLRAFAFDGMSKVVVGATAPGGSWPRAWGCVRHVYTGPANVCAMLFEPLFLDQPKHHKWLTPDGLQAVGYALAGGLCGWAIAETP